MHNINPITTVLGSEIKYTNVVPWILVVISAVVEPTLSVVIVGHRFQIFMDLGLEILIFFVFL